MMAMMKRTCLLVSALVVCIVSCAKPANGKDGSSWDDLFGQEGEDNSGYVTDGRSTLDLPYVISDHMVLQQDCEAKIWGTATPDAKVTVQASWSEEKVSVRVGKDGKWVVAVKTPKASFTPWTLTIKDSQGGGTKIEDVLVGEVWFSAGQSNMQHPMRGFGSVANGNWQPVENYQQELESASIPSFRYFRGKYQLSDSPKDDTNEGEWWISDPTSALEFQAVAYFFGRKLSQDLGVPIGIIGCAYGGSRIEAWMSRKSLEDKFTDNEWKDTSDLGKKEGDTDKQIPAQIYNGMVLPLVNYGIRGWLWYQGESNRDNHFAYDRLLSVMVDEWRTLWGDTKAEKPFYLVQLAAFTSIDPLGAPRVRDAQLRAIDLIPNCGIVNACDCGSTETVHYPGKKPVGERLALWAEAKDYGISKINPMAPVAESASFSGGKATVKLSNAGGLHLGNGRDKVLNAEVAGSDGVFQPAEVSIEGESLVFSSSKVSDPKKVRYCYSSWCEGTLYNGDGLPVFPFSL